MRQWAIIVGINEYQFLQPLNCAQQDAQALYQFLIHEAGFRPEQCLLFSNTSPQSWGRPTLPTRDNLQNWIELLIQECLQPEDSVCFFFIGCGVCYKGQDYLIPVDGHPSAIATTCIPITALLERLNAKLSKGALWVMLDISRSQGMLSHENVGVQTAQVTHQLKIPTLLSCQPGQFSREVSSLGHGLFTIALLEGLRYQPDASLAALAQFMSDRLPELGEHYWQPGQKPLLICPPTKLNQSLLSAHSFASVRTGSPGTNGYHAPHLAGAFNLSVANLATPSSTTATTLHPTMGQSVQTQGQIPTQLMTFPSNPTTSSNLPAPETEESGIGLWRPILLWGSLISLGLAGGVLWRNWAHLWTPFTAPVPKVSSVMGAGSAQSQPQGPIEGGATSQSVAKAPESSDASSANPNDIQPVSVSAGVSGVVDGNPNPALGTSAPPLNPAENSSLSANSISPTNSTSPEQAKGLPLDFAPSQGASDQRDSTILARARKMIQSDQATPYRDAIDELRKILPQDPSYLEAQAEIEAWSQTILNIAQRRATQNQVDIAVMAADLVPTEDAKRSPQAKAAIAQWCPAVRLLPGDTFPQQKAKDICSRSPV